MKELARCVLVLGFGCVGALFVGIALFTYAITLELRRFSSSLVTSHWSLFLC